MWLQLQSSWRPALEILILAVAIYYIFRFLRGTRGWPVVIGFGKTPGHNLQLLAALRSFTTLRRPLVLGVSRKSFIGKLLGADLAARLPASLACASLAVAAGVQIIRTHDVAETVQAVRMTEALLGLKRN